MVKKRDAYFSSHKIVDGLEFTPTKLPKAEREFRQVPKTLTLLGRVLTRFEYQGTWEVRFIRPTSKKGELFRVTKRDQNNIYCKVKLGDLENMWEIVIVSPAGYASSEVYSNLLQVDPRRLFIQDAPQQSSEPSVINDDKHPHFAIPVLRDNAEAPSRVSVDELLAVPVDEPPKAEENAPVEEPPKELEPAKFIPHSFLRLDPSFARNLKDTEDFVIDRALIVCAILSDPEHKAARRRDAIIAISKELDLDAFVSKQGGYQNGEKAARSIVMTLCNKAFMVSKKYGGHQSGTTSHYMLGPPAENRLKKINMPADLRKRLFTSEEIHIGEDVLLKLEPQDVLPKPQEPQDVLPQEPQDVLPQEPQDPQEPQFQEKPYVSVTDLSREFETLRGQSLHAEEMAREIQLKLDAILTPAEYDKQFLDLQNEIESLARQLENRKSQFITMTLEKEDLTNSRKIVQEELDYVQEEQKTINCRLKELKQEIKQRLEA